MDRRRGPRTRSSRASTRTPCRSRRARPGRGSPCRRCGNGMVNPSGNAALPYPAPVDRPGIVSRLRSIAWGSRVTYIIVRYMAAVVVGLEALVFARVLGAGEYGYYAIIPQVAALMIFVTIGSNAGYVYAHFRRTGPAL